MLTFGLTSCQHAEWSDTRAGIADHGLRALVVLAVVLAGFAVPGAVAAQEPSQEAANAYARAAQAQRNKAYDLAAEEWSSFLKKHPKDDLAPRASYYLGVCRLQLQQYEPAAQAFAQMLKQAPQHELAEDALLNLGWSQYTLGKSGKKNKLAEAAQTFDQLLAKNAQGKYADQALFFAAESRYASGDTQTAIPLYRKLLRQHKDSPFATDGAYALGVALEESSQFADANTVYQRFLTAHPKSELADEVRLRSAECQLRSGAAEQALTTFAELASAQNFAMADHAQMRKAACLLQLGREAEAANAYAELPKRFPQSKNVSAAVAAAGRAYYRAGQDDKARPWLSRAWENDKDLDAAHWLARLQLRTKDSGGAEKTLRAALPMAEGDEHARLQLDLGDVLYASNNRKPEALALYKSAYAAHPKAPVAAQLLYNAAFGAMELADHSQAVKLAKQFGQEFPQHELASDARYVAAESLLQNGDHALAAETFDALLADSEKHPDRPAWTLRSAWALYLDGKHQPALQRLNAAAQILTSQVQKAEADFLAGSCYFAQEQFNEAQQALQRSIQSDQQWPRAAEAHVLLSRALHRLGETAEALASAQRAARDFPNSGVSDQAYYYQGEYQLALGKYAEAEQAYGKSVQAAGDAPFAAYALHGQARSLLSAQRAEEAVEVLNSLLAKHAQHAIAADATFTRAVANRQAGKLEAALQDVESFLRSNPAGPKRSDAAYEKGLAQVALKQYEQAEQTFGELLRTAPEYAAADKVLNEWAWSLDARGESGQAAEKFAELTRRYPSSPVASQAWHYVGQTRYSANDYQGALEAYQRAFDGASTDDLKVKSLYKLGWSHFQLQRFEPARQAFQQQAALGEGLPLFADARFMEAESTFRGQQFAVAWDLFQKLKADGLQPPADVAQQLMKLHAAQAAAQVKEWQASAQWLRELEKQHPDSDYLPEARVELGWALQNLKRGDEALALYENSGASNNVVAARADFLVGEVHFEAKRFEEAIKSFRRVMFLYDAEKLPDVTPWQAQAGFEAGRCAEVQAQGAEGDARNSAVESARTFYKYVVEEHGESKFAKPAATRLKALESLE